MSSASDSDDLRREQARLDTKKAQCEIRQKERERAAQKAAEEKEKADAEIRKKVEEAEVCKKAEEAQIRDDERKRRNLKKAKLEAMSENWRSQKKAGTLTKRTVISSGVDSRSEEEDFNKDGKEEKCVACRKNGSYATAARCMKSPELLSIWPTNTQNRRGKVCLVSVKLSCKELNKRR